MEDYVCESFDEVVVSHDILIRYHENKYIARLLYRGLIIQHIVVLCAVLDYLYQVSHDAVHGGELVEGSLILHVEIRGYLKNSI